MADGAFHIARSNFVLRCVINLVNPVNPEFIFREGMDEMIMLIYSSFLLELNAKGR